MLCTYSVNGLEIVYRIIKFNKVFNIFFFYMILKCSVDIIKLLHLLFCLEKENCNLFGLKFINDKNNYYYLYF